MASPTVLSRWLTVLVLALVLALSGCTSPRSREEPGLFGRHRPPSTSTPPPSTPQPSPAPVEPQPGPTEVMANAALPVAGASTWTSGDGVGLTTRFAVHAVRRIPGATVLDYSVTPLAAPGLVTGDALPVQVDFGLTRYEGDDVAVWLLDPTRSLVYRSLAHRSRREFQHCLCTPLWASQPTFRLGRTQLLQVTFPALPERLHRVDVLLANQVPVVGVPVTPVGEVPTARHPVDLTRPAGPTAHGPVRLAPVPGLGPASRAGISLDAVLASPGVTVLRWTVRAPAGLDYRRFVLGAPLSARLPEGVPVPALNSTDGPTLRPSGGRAVLRASWMTSRLDGRPGYECLCSELDLWARSLSRPGGSVQLTTLFPGLPAGTRTVRVAIRGLPPVTIAVSALPSAAARLGPPATSVGPSWRYDPEAPPPARRPGEWPAPTPDPWQLPDYRGTVERVRALPTG